MQQAAADEAKKLVDAAALASERLVDATKEAEETATAAAAAAAAAALSAPEEAQVKPEWFDRHCGLLICARVSDCHCSLLLSNWHVVIPDIL